MSLLMVCAMIWLMDGSVKVVLFLEVMFGVFVKKSVGLEKCVLLLGILIFVFVMRVRFFCIEVSVVSCSLSF